MMRMEGEGQIAETVCEVAEELPWRKLLARGGRGTVTEFSQKSAGDAGAGASCQGADATQISEERMDRFNETDAANLQRVKDAMAERAVGGGALGQPDAAAAAAFAALLDAETRRTELAAKSQGQEKTPASPAAGGSWTESVGNRPSNLEVVASAA
jgi:hypothetical protein